MYQTHGATAHFDIWSGPTLFRVFLLRSSLQVDLSFWPSQSFAEAGGPFRLIFGQANEPAAAPVTDLESVVGMGWLYALHARSSIARGRSLQALYMINAMRDQVIHLACLRHELPPHQGRGVDDLPASITRVLADTVPQGLDHAELRRSFAGVTAALLVEVHHIDAGYASRLTAPLQELVRTSADPPSRVAPPSE